jgi:hypothetical protein
MRRRVTPPTLTSQRMLRGITTTSLDSGIREKVARLL